MHHPTTSDHLLAAYTDLMDDSRTQRLRRLASDLDETRVLYVNSTASGGGVAELLRSLVPLFNDVGVETDWRVMEASEAFFEITKTLHNGLQGEHVTVTDEMTAQYRAVTEENASAITDEYDIVVLHDPQSLGMIESLIDAFPATKFVWRCHIDLTSTSPSPLEFVRNYVERAERAVFSHREYGRRIDSTPATVIHPSIDPLSEKNRPLDQSEVEANYERLDPVPFDAETPVITQVSRFDPWKDQLGVLSAFRRVKETLPDAQLVFVGEMADDDPEAAAIVDRVIDRVADDPDVHLFTDLPATTVNFLQRQSDVVLQKSIREGFGLVVSEALWKRTPVIGSNVGGIPLQITDGHNGYLVDAKDIEAFAERTTCLLADDEIRREFGENGRSAVKEDFLLPRHLEDYLVLFNDL